MQTGRRIAAKPSAAEGCGLRHEVCSVQWSRGFNEDHRLARSNAGNTVHWDGGSVRVRIVIHLPVGNVRGRSADVGHFEPVSGDAVAGSRGAGPWGDFRDNDTARRNGSGDGERVARARIRRAANGGVIDGHIDTVACLRSAVERGTGLDIQGVADDREESCVRSADAEGVGALAVIGDGNVCDANIGGGAGGFGEHRDRVRKRDRRWSHVQGVVVQNADRSGTGCTNIVAAGVSDVKSQRFGAFAEGVIHRGNSDIDKGLANGKIH